MKILKLHIPTHLMAISIALFFCVFPTTSFGATVKPTCELKVQTSRGTEKVDENQEVLVIKGEELKITWNSKNATKAFTEDRVKIKLDGSATSSPVKKTTYTYFFENGTKKVDCAVTALVVEGSFNDSSLVTSSLKPTLSGTAKGLKTVQVSITKNETAKPLFLKKTIKVKNGTWTVKVNKALKKGTYTVSLLGTTNQLLNTIATGTVTVGTKATKVKSADTTFVAEVIPLLAGGQAKSSSTQAVLFLQVINIGKKAGTITSFEIKQNGSALTSSVVGLSIANEQKVIKRIQVQNKESLFKNNVASIPVDIEILPQQMQLFTLKATLGGNLSTQIGKQIKLDVSAIKTNGKMQSVFPLRGTLWTIVS